MAEQKLRVGFIGLGLMGEPMARNIVKKGFPLSVYNRTTAKTTPFKKLGATVYATPKELAENCDVVITVVTGPKDVRQVLLGKNGVGEGAKKGLIVIDMSTIGPKAAQEIGEDLKTFGIDFIDAPVTGSTTRATTGELTIFIGGKKSAFEKVEPVLAAMGTDLQYVGSSGLGQAVKLINNLLVAESLAALGEGMLLADAMGLDRNKVATALANAPVLSPMMKLKMPKVVKNDFSVAFSMANQDKDLKLALKELNKPLPVLKMVEKFYQEGAKNGLAGSDNSAILEVLAKKIK